MYITESTIIPLSYLLKIVFKNVLMFNLLGDIVNSCIVLEYIVNIIYDWKYHFSVIIVVVQASQVEQTVMILRRPVPY